MRPKKSTLIGGAGGGAHGCACPEREIHDGHEMDAVARKPGRQRVADRRGVDDDFANEQAHEPQVQRVKEPLGELLAGMGARVVQRDDGVRQREQRIEREQQRLLVVEMHGSGPQLAEQARDAEQREPVARTQRMKIAIEHRAFLGDVAWVIAQIENAGGAAQRVDDGIRVMPHPAFAPEIDEDDRAVAAGWIGGHAAASS